MSNKIDTAFQAWRLSPAYPRWNDFKVYDPQGVTTGVVPTQTAEQHERTAFAAGCAAQRDQDLKAVEAVRVELLSGDSYQSACDEIKRRIRGDRKDGE